MKIIKINTYIECPLYGGYSFLYQRLQMSIKEYQWLSIDGQFDNKEWNLCYEILHYYYS